MDIQQLSLKELYQIANAFSLTRSSKKSEMVKIIENHYYELQRFISYKYIRQLGHEGKDGRTFLALDKSNKEVAIKIFKPNKSTRQIEQEASFQSHASTFNITPKVIEYNGRGKYIVMEKLDTTLYSLFRKQDGQLTLKQQQQLISLFKVLDKTGIFHADPNPLNFMYKRNKLYIIDFGFAKSITTRVKQSYGENPNLKYLTRGLCLKLRKLYPKAELRLLESYGRVR